MARILILSSWVAHGHVGLSAAAPALQALGHSVTQLPTTLLSNHPGWPHAAGRAMPPDTLREMIDALGANGWLTQQDALLTGYLPSVAHVALAAELMKRLRESAPNALRVVVDPVMGDEPTGLYIPEAVACAIRDALCPLADILTPNLFELGWLAKRPVSSLAETRAAAETLSTLWPRDFPPLQRLAICMRWWSEAPGRHICGLSKPQRNGRAPRRSPRRIGQRRNRPWRSISS